MSRDKHVTNWSGVLNDLFGTDISNCSESTHDSSSGFASDGPNYYGPTDMSTFKGTKKKGELEVSRREKPSESHRNVISPTNYDRAHCRESPLTPLSYRIPNINCNIRCFGAGSSTPTMGHLQSHVSNLSVGDSSKQSHMTQTDLNIFDMEKKFPVFKNGVKYKQIRPCPFDLLTDDVIVKIFSSLPSDQVCRSARVCQRWYRLVWDPTLWKGITINNDKMDVNRALKYLTRKLSTNTPTICIIVEKINLNGSSKLTDKGLRTISRRCPELRHLELQGCANITETAIFEISSFCVNLEYLDITGCSRVTCIRLTDALVQQASALHLRQIYLRHLDMTDCYALDDEGLRIVAMHCSQVQFLYLRRCVRIGDAGIQALADYCYCLRELSVSDCRKITDFGMCNISKVGESLRYLSVAKCDKVSDVGMIQIAKQCKKLRYLNVRGCEAVSDDAVDCISRLCIRLRSLDLGKCDITDEALELLALNSPQLKKLSVKSCEAITDSGVMNIAYHCRSLQQLNIQDCHLSVESYRTVKKYCKKCFIEHTNPGFY
ncbi:hypothetical protein ScPMuIL_012289 [Solemya velum]